jgi:hypothetical protein
MANFTFSKIWIIVVIAVFAVAGVFCWQYFDTQKENEILNEEITELEQSEEQAEEQVEIIAGRIVELGSQLREVVDQKIIFYDPEKNKINEIGDEKILRQLTESLGLSFGLLREVRLCDHAIERPSGVFYFFAGNGIDCGKNCGWILYKYESQGSRLSHIEISEEEKKEYDSNLFGGNVSGYYFSPDKSKIIVSAVGSGGLCYVGEDMGIIDLEQSNFTRIKNFNDYYEYSIHKVEYLDWIGNDCFKFSLSERNCGKDETMKRVRYYKYYFPQDKLELVKEEFQELDEREQNRF